MGYTVGELAKKLGVSARTVRFYEEKKLLQPCGRSESGYRIYDDHGAERLQKIIMLRFLAEGRRAADRFCEVNKAGLHLRISNIFGSYGKKVLTQPLKAVLPLEDLMSIPHGQLLTCPESLHW